jgi:hypothetical protein
MTSQCSVGPKFPKKACRSLVSGIGGRLFSAVREDDGNAGVPNMA